MGTLRINGRDMEFADGVPATLLQLLQRLDINAATVVAEIDGLIVPREKFERTQLTDSQTIELIRFVGGG